MSSFVPSAIRKVAFIMWLTLILIGRGRAFLYPSQEGGDKAFFCTVQRGSEAFFAQFRGGGSIFMVRYITNLVVESPEALRVGTFFLGAGFCFYER